MKQDTKNSPGELAEQAGHAIAAAALDAILHAPSQSARIAILVSTLRDALEPCNERDRVIDGFAVGMILVVDQGLLSMYGPR